MVTLDTTKPPMRALLLENIHPDATARLTKAGYEVETRKGALSEDELIEALPGVSLLGIRSRTHVTERVLDAGAGPGRGGRVLHRRQPDRPGRRVARAASRSSTRRSPTPAAWSSWSWPRSSR